MFIYLWPFEYLISQMSIFGNIYLLLFLLHVFIEHLFGVVDMKSCWLGGRGLGARNQQGRDGRGYKWFMSPISFIIFQFY